MGWLLCSNIQICFDYFGSKGWHTEEVHAWKVGDIRNKNWMCRWLVLAVGGGNVRKCRRLGCKANFAPPLRGIPIPMHWMLYIHTTTPHDLISRLPGRRSLFGCSSLCRTNIFFSLGTIAGLTPPSLAVSSRIYNIFLSPSLDSCYKPWPGGVQH